MRFELPRIARSRLALPGLKVGLLLALILLVAVLPRFLGEYRVSEFTYVAIYFIALLGLNILTGYNGQISLGHGAFMAVGAYTSAVLTLGRPGLEAVNLHPSGVQFVTLRNTHDTPVRQLRYFFHAANTSCSQKCDNRTL